MLRVASLDRTFQQGAKRTKRMTSMVSRKVALPCSQGAVTQQRKTQEQQLRSRLQRIDQLSDSEAATRAVVEEVVAEAVLPVQVATIAQVLLAAIAKLVVLELVVRRRTTMLVALEVSDQTTQLGNERIKHKL